MRKGSVDDCDCLNLDEEIRTGGKRWYRGYCADRAEIAGEYVGVLVERVRIGNVGARQDDVGCLCSRDFKADLDILACLLDLHPHVTFADDLALLIDGQLPADIHSPLATLDRGDHRRRVICACRSIFLLTRQSIVLADLSRVKCVGDARCLQYSAFQLKRQTGSRWMPGSMLFVVCPPLVNP